MTTGEDINKRFEQKNDDVVMGMAEQLFKNMGIKVPDIPVCYIHQRPFAGQFIEYTTDKREVVKICMPCVIRAVDKLIRDND
jgi:hypothetical protein